MSTEISRRGFLTGVGAVAAGAAIAGLAGCGNSQSQSAQTASSAATSQAAKVPAGMSDASSSVWKLDDVGEPSETVFADVVVIGGGGTGMAATIQASELGLDVVLLEKGGELGGAFSATDWFSLNS